MSLLDSQKLVDSGNLTEDTDNESSDNKLAEKDLEKGDNEDVNAEQDGNQSDAPLQNVLAQDVPAKDPNLIEWDGPDDPGNPMNWPRRKKWIVTMVLGTMTFVVTFASSVFSTATFPTAKEYGVSTEVTTLGTSLFVLGFAIGPMVSIVCSS